MHEKLAGLKWQLQMGADEAVSDSVHNRFEIKTRPLVEKKNQVAKEISTSTPQRAGIGNPLSTTQMTRQLASGCGTLNELRSAVEEFKDLSITKTATSTVFADGNPNAQIMLIGEAPGAEEDIQGIPFCGASGKLLGQMLGHINLTREKNFYITNTIFWRPPGNRRPTPEELTVCLPFVEKHIALIQPKLILLVGGTAVTSLLGNKEGISSLRGKFFEYSNIYLNTPVKTTAIFHPSYLLRSPGQKRIAWKDLLMLKEYINNTRIQI